MMESVRKLIVPLLMMYTCECTNLTSCPITGTDLRSASRRLYCNDTYSYHCILNGEGHLVEKCLQFRWMTKGYCPVFIENANNGLGAIHEKMCQKDDENVKGCPSTRAYKSSQVFQFPACFDVTNSMKRKTVPFEHDEDTRTSTASGDEGNVGITGGGIVAIVAVVIVPLLVIGIIITVIYFKNKRKRDYSEGTAVLQLDEDIPLIPEQEYTRIPERRIVQSAAFAEGLHILKEHGILIITGHIGSGKTTAMENIIRLLQEEDSEWKVKDISFLALGRCKSSNDKLIIKWDDCFGKFVTNPVKKKNILDIFTKISEWVAEGDGNRKCILSMRETEFVSFCLNESDLFRTNDKAANNKVCLDNLSQSEKYSLLAEMGKEVSSFDESSHIHKTKTELMCETESVTFSPLGWPLICRLASMPFIEKNIVSFKEDPVRCVMSLFNTLQSTNQQLYCAMIFVLFKGGNICRTDTAFLKEVSEKLASAQDGEKLMGSGNSESTDNPMTFSRDELNNIFHKHPHYFVNKDSECYEFHHEVFVLWLLCHFYQSFPEATIEHFDLDILIELLRPNNYIVESNETHIEMLCSFDDNVPEEKHDYPAKLVKGDGDKKPVQCEVGMILKQTEEGNSENQSWKFTLEEKMFSCFINRVVKETEEVQKLQVEKEQTYGMLEGHPLLEDKTFSRIYRHEKAMISAPGASKGKS